jgi:hypothetical protein
MEKADLVVFVYEDDGVVRMSIPGGSYPYEEGFKKVVSRCLSIT